MDRRILQVELPDDVIPNPGGGRRSQRHEGQVSELFPEQGQLPVFGAEVMPPFADAMGLIHRHLLDIPLTQGIEERAFADHQTLGGQVEEFEFALMQAAPPGLALFFGQ